MQARLAGYGDVSTELALRSDRQLASLVAGARPLGAGIGGTSVRLEVAGRPVFVKLVPLTDLELRPEHRLSTANLFGLPTRYQYGIGSAGFGAWRELAAHVLTTNWVLTGRCAAFPLLYHWRVLPRAASAGTRDEHAEMDDMVASWGGSAAVRERLTAIAGATASLALFLEYVPQTLHDWLNAQVAAGPAATDAAVVFVRRAMREATGFMDGNGLLHFDAHFRNVLTDGRQVFLGDLGLATSPRFDLSAVERAFVADNAGHDVHYAAVHLATWLAVALVDPPDRPEFLRRCAAGEVPASVPPEAAAVLTRTAPTALVFHRFYRALRDGDPTARYPRVELDSTVDGRGPSTVE